MALPVAAQFGLELKKAADGITDSQREQFHLHLANLKPGEHVIVVRVYDSAGNAGLAKVVSE